MLKVAWAVLALLALAGTATAYEAWMAGAGPTASAVLTNMEETPVKAHLVHPNGNIDQVEIGPGQQVTLPLSARGNEPGIQRIGHRLITEGKLASAMQWRGPEDDAFTGLIASSSLGTEHVLFSMNGQNPSVADNLVSIVAIRDGTTLTLTYDQAMDDGQAVRPPGHVQAYELDAYEALVLKGPDPGGLQVQSSEPVAVFNYRRDFRTGGDHKGMIGEQVPPLSFATADLRSCLPTGVPYDTGIANLLEDTALHVWRSESSLYQATLVEPWSTVHASFSDGLGELNGGKPLHAYQVVASEAYKGPALAYLPAQNAWYREVDVVIPAGTPAAKSYVMAVHATDDPPEFSAGQPLTTIDFGRGQSCTVTSVLDSEVRGVRVTTENGAAAWVWTRDNSKGVMGAAWPSCLAEATGEQDLEIQANPLGTKVAVVWSDPEADCQSSAFKLERSREGGAFQTIATPSTAVYLDSTVEACVEYQYRISRADGTGTAQSERVKVPDEYDCEPPPDDDEEVVCPSLREPTVVYVDATPMAELDVRGPDGEAWTDGVAFALHVISNVGIQGEVDWSQWNVAFATFGVAPGTHEVKLIFEPFEDSCPLQGYDVPVLVGGGPGGPGGGDDDGGGDNGDGGGPGGPGGGTSPPPVCPVLAEHLLEAAIETGDRFTQQVRLAEGGETGYTWVGKDLEAIPGLAFDAGDGEIDWIATEPGMYKGTVELVTMDPRCDDEVAVRILVQPRKHDPEKDEAEDTDEDQDADEPCTLDCDATNETPAPEPTTSLTPGTGTDKEPLDTEGTASSPTSKKDKDTPAAPWAWSALLLALAVGLRRQPTMRR